jgi:hypothetical protein
MLRRLALLAIPSLLFTFGTFGGCSATDPALGQVNDGCDEDLQCTKPLVCSCVEIRGTGDDGNDEIVKHGTCQHPGFKCIRDDAGGDGPKVDTAPLDAFRPDTATETELDAPATDAAIDDADAGG